MALTERQQEIKALQDKGKTPREIAEALGITVNGIYQQLRRMKAGGAKPGAAKKPAKPAALKPPAPKPTPAPPVSNVPHPMTPLQAIRARKSAIESQIKESVKNEEAAAAHAVKAKEQHAIVVAKHADELRQLEVAEGVITGQVPLKNAPKPPAKPSGKNGKSALASVPPAAPVDPPAAVPDVPAAEPAPAAPVADPATA